MASFFAGVIEGFYGRQWSWRERHDYVSFLPSASLDTYIYAPKGDVFLRSRWAEEWPGDQFQGLLKLSEHCRSQSVAFGIGLSPLELFRDFDAAGKAALIRKVEHINQLEPSVLCILFDDMPGDFPLLAEKQLEIIDTVLAHSQASHHLVCPTYYSFDPVLEDVFGDMPTGYFEQLGVGLDSAVDVLWTGERVISPSVTEAHLLEVERLFLRRPVLWDNIVVNDGKKTADFLRLMAIDGRKPAIKRSLAGQLVNPMSQPYLSQLSLATLIPAYEKGGRGLFDDVVQRQLPNDLASLILRDKEAFNQQGLVGLTSVEKANKINEYQSCQHVAAQEIVQWLRGDYCFDPACLTG